jgi:hypothetical protein
MVFSDAVCKRRFGAYDQLAGQGIRPRPERIAPRALSLRKAGLLAGGPAFRIYDA